MSLNQQIITTLQQQPQSITELAHNCNVTWRTAKKHLEELKALHLVFKKTKGVKQVFFLLDQTNYFDLPLSKPQEDVILAVFSQIRQTTTVTKTQALKILYETNKQFNLNIPFGWYLYGPICVKPFTHQPTSYTLSKEIRSFINETTSSYASKTNSEVEDLVYQENPLYQLKKSIVQTPLQENLNLLLMDFIKEVPQETKELVTDCARAIMLIGWTQETRNAFELTWKYVATIYFKNTLQEHYSYDIRSYFSNLEQKKQDAQLEILNLVKQYTDTTHSQDTKYQSYLQNKQSPHDSE